MFTIGVTDATHANSLSFDGDLLDKDKLEKAILASTAMPFIFPYVKSSKAILIDGGVLLNIDIRSAIRRCKQ